MASSTTVKSTNANLPALALVGVVGGSAIVFSVLSAPFLVIPAFRRLGAIPWMTTPMHITKQAISQLVLRQSHINNKKSTSKQLKKFIDLGSGDGRVVIAAAQAGYQATGIELNPVLVSLSYIAAYRAGVLSKVSFRMKDFWSINLREYDAIRYKCTVCPTVRLPSTSSPANHFPFTYRSPPISQYLTAVLYYISSHHTPILHLFAHNMSIVFSVSIR